MVALVSGISHEPPPHSPASHPVIHQHRVPCHHAIIAHPDGIQLASPDLHLVCGSDLQRASCYRGVLNVQPAFVIDNQRHVVAVRVGEHSRSVLPDSESYNTPIASRVRCVFSVRPALYDMQPPVGIHDERHVVASSTQRGSSILPNSQRHHSNVARGMHCILGLAQIGSPRSRHDAEHISLDVARSIDVNSSVSGSNISPVDRNSQLVCVVQLGIDPADIVDVDIAVGYGGAVFLRAAQELGQLYLFRFHVISPCHFPPPLVKK